jgi:3-hydroxybutyryl-CoA dehydratase
MITKWFDQFEVGETEVTRARTITESDVVMFSMFSGDWYPLHTDQEYAKNSPFGERIAHGMLVLSVMTGLVELEPGYIIAFYGMENVRFLQPTKIGDTIHVESKVLDTREKGDKAGVVSFQVEVKNQAEKTVVSTIMKMLVAREQ